MSNDFDTIIKNIIKDSPAGELEEVYQDLITIAGENSKETIIDAIAEYNVENSIPIDVDGKDVIISKYNKQGTKFVDPVNGIQFSVDHLHQKGLDVEEYSADIDADQKKAITDLGNYLSTNFPGRATFAVLPLEEQSKTAIIIVNIDVHYYEDGNVKFHSSKLVEETNIKDPVASIKELEHKFEQDLQESFTDLNEKQFKSLRRRLPITRARVNWGKAIGNYRLGRDAAQGK
ncbi:F-actin capping protein alpha subunit [Nakaseomyces glabratus]